jgi:hypothetical protein
VSVPPRRYDSVDGLLTAYRLSPSDEEPFPNDGWSGASLTRFTAGTRRYVLKRDGWDRDWIARATNDVDLREARIAESPPAIDGVELPYLGVAPDGPRGAAILMPDLSDVLFRWERRMEPATLDHVLLAVASFHAAGWLALSTGADPFPAHDPCPLDRRLLLLSPSAAERYQAEGLPVGGTFGSGWAAFRRHATPEASALVDALSSDVTPLLDALETLPSTRLHGDAKLANAGIRPSGTLVIVDWQMTLCAPVAVELAWFLVSNAADLPITPDAVWRRYVGQLSRAPGGRAALGDEDAQTDLVWIIGLLLRGWRKGLDATSGTVLASGVPAADDLAWWCERAVGAAERRLRL